MCNLANQGTQANITDADPVFSSLIGDPTKSLSAAKYPSKAQPSEDPANQNFLRYLWLEQTRKKLLAWAILVIQHLCYHHQSVLFISVPTQDR